MNDKHTQNLISAGKLQLGEYPLFAQSERIHCVGTAATEADARRMAACWNACDGIETETLQRLPQPFNKLLSRDFQDLVAELAAARALQAQLVDALQLAREDLDQVGLHDHLVDYDQNKRTVDAVDAAIIAAGVQP